MVLRVLSVAGALVRSAFRGLQASPVTSGVAVATIAISLVLVGAFALLVANMQGLLDDFADELQVVAYLADGVEQDAQRALAAEVSGIEGVASVEIVSREQALERFEKNLGAADLLEGLEGNPLPASLQVTLEPDWRTPERIAQVALAVDELAGIEELAHGQRWVEGFSRAVTLLRSAAYGLGSVLGFAALLIVANTIRLAVYARKDEIEILSLVGASRTFVRVPFLLEGTLQGLAGGLIALALLYGAWSLWLPDLEVGLELFLGNRPPRFFGGAESAWLVSGGAGLGILGSGTALLGWRV